MDKKIKKWKFLRGFTTIELLAILAIIAIMLVVSMVSMNNGNRDAKLKAAQREVASAIRMAQSNALQGKTVSGVVPKYWGFKFTANNAYTIFSSDGSSDTNVENFTLNNGARLNAFTSSDSTRITFSVPNADVVYPSGLSSLTLTLQIGSLASPNKTVTVAARGVVTEN